MKLQFFIFSIFLISLAANSSITTKLMSTGSETTFSSLKSNQKQYYTVSAMSNYKYTFKIKVKNTYISSSTSLSISYITHSTRYPDTSSYYNEAQGSLYFNTISTYTSGYNTYESSSYTVSKYSISYLTFVLTPYKNIDSASITITKTYDGSSSSSSSNVKGVVFTIVFFVIFFICIIFCIIFFVCRAFCECFKNATIIQTSPQPNYTSLSPQYIQPQPIQPQIQPIYIVPPQYNQPNEYAQPPQYINPQQNVNGYSPGQLYASS